MRAKKKILLVEHRETERDTLTFVLNNYSYAVTPVANSAQAMGAMQRDRFDMIVSNVHLGRESGNVLVGNLRAAYSDTPNLLYSPDVSDYKRASRADFFLGAHLYSMSMLVERIRVAAARKRGPKKGCMQVPPEAAAVSA